MGAWLSRAAPPQLPRQLEPELGAAQCNYEARPSPRAAPHTRHPQRASPRARAQLLRAFNGWMDERGLQYTLGAGTLLGAMRNEPPGLLQWEHDVDVYVLAREASLLLQQLTVRHRPPASPRWQPQPLTTSAAATYIRSCSFLSQQAQPLRPSAAASHTFYARSRSLFRLSRLTSPKPNRTAAHDPHGTALRPTAHGRTTARLRIVHSMVHYMVHSMVHHTVHHMVHHMVHHTAHHMVHPMVHHTVHCMVHHMVHHIVPYMVHHTVHHTVHYTVHHIVHHMVHSMVHHTAHACAAQRRSSS